jgi:hypothetical protein
LKPKVIYDAANKANENRFDPSYLFHLPIQMEGTNYLIHPIADLVYYERGTKQGMDHVDSSFTISNYGENEITGYLQNLKFQRTDSDSISTLTETSPA